MEGNVWPPRGCYGRDNSRRQTSPGMRASVAPVSSARLLPWPKTAGEPRRDSRRLHS